MHVTVTMIGLGAASADASMSIASSIPRQANSAHDPCNTLSLPLAPPIPAGASTLSATPHYATSLAQDG